MRNVTTIASRRLALTSLVVGVLAAIQGLSATAETLASYEAENAGYYGGARVENNHDGFSGTGFLGGFTDSERGSAAVDFIVDAPKEGDYVANIRYANGTGSTKTLAMYLDDTYWRTVTFNAGAHWGDWKTASESIALDPGSHIVSLRFNNDNSGNVNLDRLSIEGNAPVVTNGELTVDSLLQLEHVGLSGGARIEAEHDGYSGDGYVGGFTDANQGSAQADFNVSLADSGDYRFTLRYANGTGSARSITFVVDGAAQTLALPATAGWGDYGTVSFSASLVAGVQPASFRYGATDTGNVNIDNIALQKIIADPDPVDPDPTEPVSVGNVDAGAMTLSGGTSLQSEHGGYNGTGFVGGFIDANKNLARARFTLAINEPGYHALTIRYANGTPTTQTLSVLGGTPASAQVSFPASGGWATWQQVTVNRWFASGEQEVELFFANTDSGNINIDAVDVTFLGEDNPDPVTPPDPDPVDPIEPTTPVGGADYQAERGFFSGGAEVRSDVSGFTGTGVVAQGNQAGSRVIFTVNAGTTGRQVVSIHYDNPTNDTKVAQLRIDGLVAGEIELAPTSGLQTLAYDMPLRRGVGTISLHALDDNTGGYLLDRITLQDGSDLADRGATVGYQTYEAEEGSTNASVRGPSRIFHEMEAEASGRKAVRLNQVGQYVEITLTQPANAMVLRASIPDTLDGVGQAQTIAVYANGNKLLDHEVTSYYSWVYGSYPYVSQPSQGSPQRYFDDSRVKFAQVLPAGTTLRFQVDSNSNAEWYDIDLIELEMLEPPRAKPPGFISVTEYGAVANDGIDDYDSVLNTIIAARNAGTGVWLPQGTFTLRDRVNVADITVTGAGPWYSVIAGQDGKGGFYATGGNVTLAHFMVSGETFERNDGADHAAFEGNFGRGSLIQNVWIEHTKVGLWTVSGTEGLLATQMRIRNTFADGVNLNKGILDTHITQSVIRNTGDDALAMWSQGEAVTRSAFINNTVQTPLLGNGAGIYGGTANQVRNNIFRDTLTGSAGIAIGTRFNPTPLTGTTIVDNCELIRTGGYEPNWETELPAIWIFADSLDITAPIRITNTDIVDSTYQAFLISWQKRVEGLYIGDVNINGTGSTVLEANATGNAYLERVNAQNVAGPATAWPDFLLEYGEGVTGL
jgi:hypothetical protein